MAGSPSTDLADLLNEMVSAQERLRRHGVSFGTSLPGPPAGQPKAEATHADLGNRGEAHSNMLG